MLDRYSADARRAVEFAREEAARLRHPYVGTEHLLLGLLAGGDNDAARALRRAGASLALCREKVTEALASRSHPTSTHSAGELEVTDRAARALDRAARLSARLKSDQVQTSHVLLSVLDVEGTAGQVLRGLSVDLGAVRQALLEPGPAPAPEAADAVVENDGEPELVDQGIPEGPEPVCSRCGVALKGSLSRSVIASGDGVDVEVIYCSSCGASLSAARAPITTSRAASPARRAGNGPSRDPAPPRPRRPRA